MNEKAEALRARAAREKVEELQKRAAAIESRLQANDKIRGQEVHNEYGSQTRQDKRQVAIAQGVV
jgi:hypothetical protein